MGLRNPVARGRGRPPTKREPARAKALAGSEAHPQGSSRSFNGSAADLGGAARRLGLAAALGLGVAARLGAAVRLGGAASLLGAGLGSSHHVGGGNLTTRGLGVDHLGLGLAGTALRLGLGGAVGSLGRAATRLGGLGSHRGRRFLGRSHETDHLGSGSLGSRTAHDGAGGLAGARSLFRATGSLGSGVAAGGRVAGLRRVTSGLGAVASLAGGHGLGLVTESRRAGGGLQLRGLHNLTLGAAALGLGLRNGSLGAVAALGGLAGSATARGGTAVGAGLRLGGHGSDPVGAQGKGLDGLAFGDVGGASARTVPRLGSTRLGGGAACTLVAGFAATHDASTGRAGLGLHGHGDHVGGGSLPLGHGVGATGASAVAGLSHTTGGAGGRAIPIGLSDLRSASRVAGRLGGAGTRLARHHVGLGGRERRGRNVGDRVRSGGRLHDLPLGRAAGLLGHLGAAGRSLGVAAGCGLGGAAGAALASGCLRTLCGRGFCERGGRVGDDLGGRDLGYLTLERDRGLAAAAALGGGLGIAGSLGVRRARGSARLGGFAVHDLGDRSLASGLRGDGLLGRSQVSAARVEAFGLRLRGRLLGVGRGGLLSHNFLSNHLLGGSLLGRGLLGRHCLSAAFFEAFGLSRRGQRHQRQSREGEQSGTDHRLKDGWSERTLERLRSGDAAPVDFQGRQGPPLLSETGSP